MPQFIITPWRDMSELVKARDQFYRRSSSNSSSQTVDERREAVELVRAWKIRGQVPHAVESTGLLVDAMLNDTPNVSPWCIRAAYSIAFARFVTGFVDSSQEGKWKLSMYKVADQLGLPTSFVEIRHRIAHEELPSVTVLREAARRSLDWLWDYFWKHLDERMPGGGMIDDEKEAAPVVAGMKEQFREVLKPYVKRRVVDVREGKGKGKESTSTATATAMEKDGVTDVISKACVRLCRGDEQTLSVLVTVLLEPKFLIPANRTIQSSLDPAFAIWTPLLRSLSTHQQAFLSTLVDELLIQLTLPSSLDVALDSYREAVYLWLRYILTDETWSAARRRWSAGLDMDCVVATCLMGQNVWSVKLVAELVCGDAGGLDERVELRRDWAELVRIALAELNGGRRGVEWEEEGEGEGEGEGGESDDGVEEMDVQQQSRGENDLVDEGGQLDGMDHDDVVVDDGPGWRMWRGTWIPKPIGMI
ncbi:MAG: rRNA-processing protein las1 [Peltula sp. TS41687]|nr:MAG: rRNA-processing protein las1 [Peltula sp. TS41687]